MRILVVSDTHGHNDNLKKILAETGRPDCLIHLGDSECGELGIRQLSDCPMHLVSGNCDFFCELPRTKLIELEGHRILITHGHYHYVNAGPRHLIADARKNGCGIALFGHTHRPYLDQTDPSLTILNPGSLSFPRQENRRPSYAVLTLTKGCPVEAEIYYL